MKPKHMIGALSVLGAAAATGYAAADLMVRAALDRELPRAVSHAGPLLRGHSPGEEDSVFFRQLEEASARLAVQTTETVTITSYDGIPLVAHYRPCPQSKRIVIAAHGWRSSWHRDFGMVADCLHENGCSVLYIEQRGQNASGGDCMGFGVTERFDILDWVDYIQREKSSALPIYLAGISMGASTVLMASGLPLPAQVHGILADCGFTSPAAIWKHVATENLHMYFPSEARPLQHLISLRLPADGASVSTVEALQRTRIPVLFIHGEADRFVPFSMTLENYAACASPKRLFSVKDADHGMSFYLDPDGYRNAVLDFWREFD